MALKLYEIKGNFGTIETTSNLYFADGFDEAFKLAEMDGLIRMRKYVRTKAGDGFDKGDNLGLNGRFLN